MCGTNHSSLTDQPTNHLVQAVYTVLREAEHRSIMPLAYWNLPGAKLIVPRQRRCVEALKV